MKKILTITFLFLTFGILHSQNKYLVYFKDKGSVESNSLNKTSQEYLTAISQLSDKSIERRKKIFGDDFIDYKDIPVNQYYVEILKSLNIEIVWELKWFNAVSCRLNAEQLDKIKELSFVQKIDKVKTLKYKKGIEETVNNILPKQKINQYNHDYGPSLTQAELSDIPLVHDLDFTGKDVLIGILDAGFAWQDHPSLKDANVIAEHDFVYGDSLTGNDGDASHGTAVFSLIGGFDEGSLIGPSFNSNYILAKTEDIFSETHTEEDNYAAALEWMEALGADITTSSLGYSDFDAGEGSYTYEDMDGKTTIVTQASEIAFQKGVLCITSAGNEGNKPWKYITAPADGFNTIAIGAVTTVNRLAPFSSVGPSYDGRLKPELVAQGYSCYKAVAFTEGYNFGNGTSYSGPIAAGIAGQLLSAFPYLTNTQARSILFESGDNVEDPNNERGYGLISSLRAVTYPNLVDNNDGSYIVNKIFYDENGVVENSAKIYFTKNSEEMLYSGDMFFTGDMIYRYQFSGSEFSAGDTINFYFNYSDSSSNINRNPSTGYYSFIYSSLNVVLNTELNPIDEIPKSYTLYQNFPNPFNSWTTIYVDVPEATNIELKIFNILGQEVVTLFSGKTEPGKRRFFWNGLDRFGSRVASGAYIYNVKASNFTQSKKMIFLK